MIPNGDGGRKVGSQKKIGGTEYPQSLRLYVKRSSQNCLSKRFHQLLFEVIAPFRFFVLFKSNLGVGQLYC